MVLGGFKQKDRDDTNVIISDTESILNMCKRLVPSLKVIFVCTICQTKVILPKMPRERRKLQPNRKQTIVLNQNSTNKSSVSGRFDQSFFLFDLF